MTSVTTGTSGTAPSAAPRVDDLIDLVDVDIENLRGEVAGETLSADDVLGFRRELSNLLYEVLHAGHRVEAGTLPFRLRDPLLEQRLAEATPQHATRVRAVPAQAPDGIVPPAGRVLVERDGVRVWMPASAVHDGGGERPGTVLLDVAAARPAVSPGFFLADSSATPDRIGPALRVYLHLADHDAAVEAWRRVLGRLETTGLGYRAKVLSCRALYPRRDALVVYLPERSRPLAAEVADAVADLAGVEPETSAFARRWGAGLATAWEPNDPRGVARGLSFGQHRASTIGRALIDAALSGEDPRAAVRAACREANVDPDDLSRNDDSPDGPGAPIRDTAPAASRVRTPDDH